MCRPVAAPVDQHCESRSSTRAVTKTPFASSSSEEPLTLCPEYASVAKSAERPLMAATQNASLKLRSSRIH